MPPRVSRRRIVVTGVVQGVGFRPFVHGLATRLGLAGWVLNDGRGVVIEVEGEARAIERFDASLRAEAPPLAHIVGLAREEIAVVGETGFRVDESRTADAGAAAAIPADVATCDDCLRELRDPGDRRHRYPFINCTNCGPRFTIVTATPYDRARTTMAAFPLCDDCAREYRDPSDRRFHAEPVACPRCGPRVWFEPAGKPIPALDQPRAPVPAGTAPILDEDALAACLTSLREGKTVAIKGIGGFHLACDARSTEAVARLRARKQRPSKPFAVMAASLAQAREFALVDAAAERALADRARPIVLLPLRTDAGARPLAPGVAPGVGTIGVMLPYAPLHHLLADGMPLVLTSGNLSDEPIAIGNMEARMRLEHVADAFLMHDRPIHVSCDDSVVRLVRLGAATREVSMRRSRGHAPLAVPLATDGPTVLAVGGDLKAACAIATGGDAILSQHVGDQESPDSQSALAIAAEHLLEAWRATPAALVADRHPGYHSARWALREATRLGVPLLRVQHHHAHVAAVLAEHHRDALGGKPVIGVALDGTGYGDDGAIWGGEWLVADARRYIRVAHLSYVPLPGGDAAVRRPRRVALAHLANAACDWRPELPCVAATPGPERLHLARSIASGDGAPWTSSMGRLLDALASIIGIRQDADYEAQAAMEMEAVATAWLGDGAIDTAMVRDAMGAIETPSTRGAVALDPAPLVSYLVGGVQRGAPTGELALHAHLGVARMIVQGAKVARARGGVPPIVALGGGVFLNALVLAGATTALATAGFDVLLPKRVPPGDGGLALGQVVVGRAMLAEP